MLVVVANLKNRVDRKSHICHEFSLFTDFDLKVVNAIQENNGALGLWKTLNVVLSEIVKIESEYFIFCEDDHSFTKDFSYEVLKESILEAENLDADILLGGVSWFDVGVQISTNLFWIKKYSGNQFLIIFKRFYQKILSYSGFDPTNAADYVISNLSDRKFLITPFLSIQKDFGYSDVTAINNYAGRINKLFESSTKKIEILKAVAKFYNSTSTPKIEVDFSEIVLPVYKIYIDNEEGENNLVDDAFATREEFEVTYLNCRADKYWQTFKNCIKTCQEDDEDVLIICNDKNRFTEDYEKNFFLRSIVEAFEKKCDLLLPGAAGLNEVVPINSNLFWIDHFSLCNCMVIYRSFYKKILESSYDGKKSLEEFISDLTPNKMLLYPFCITTDSLEEEFPASAIDTKQEEKKKFVQAGNLLRVYKTVYKNYIEKH